MKNIKCRSYFFYRNEWCEKIVDSPDPEEARDCNYFREMTNADRIRSMSDEELKDWYCKNRDCGDCDFCIPFGCTFKDWLQKPAGEEDKHEPN